MIDRVIYSHYSKFMREGIAAIGWYREKYFWIALALSVHYSKKHFKSIGFYSDSYAAQMANRFEIDFDSWTSNLETLDLPASLWSIAKIHAIKEEVETYNKPFLHIDSDAVIRFRLPDEILSATVVVQNKEPLDCYHFYERGWKMFLEGDFDLSYNFLYGYAKKVDPVNTGIVGGNDTALFGYFAEEVLAMIEVNAGKFPDKPIPEFCVTLEQWLLNVVCTRNKVPVTVLLTDLEKDAKKYGFHHFLAASKRDKKTCENLEKSAKGIIPAQVEMINEYFGVKEMV